MFQVIPAVGATGELAPPSAADAAAQPTIQNLPNENGTKHLPTISNGSMSSPSTSTPESKLVNSPQPPPGPQPPPPSSLLYLGIIMERPSSYSQNNNSNNSIPQNSKTTNFSWGLSITKDRSNYAMVVGIQHHLSNGNTTTSTNNYDTNRPRIKWCRVTNRVPSASTIFAAKKINSSNYSNHSNHHVVAGSMIASVAGASGIGIGSGSIGTSKGMGSCGGSGSGQETDNFEMSLMTKFFIPISSYHPPSYPFPTALLSSQKKSNPCNNKNNNSNNENNYNTPSVTSPTLQPGDAIISINGLPASCFDSASSMASYIRQYCTDKLVIVAMREKRVWSAAWNEIVSSRGNNNNNYYSGSNKSMDQKSRVSKSVGAAWKNVFQIGSNVVSRGGIAGGATATLFSRSNGAFFGIKASSSSHIVGPDTSANFQIKKRKQPNNININSNSNNKQQHHHNYYRSSQKSGPKKLKFDSSNNNYHLNLLLADTRQFLNHKFNDANGNPIPYCDNSEFDLDEGMRIRRFLNPEIENDFHGWLKKRKVVWKESRRVRHPLHSAISSSGNGEEKEEDLTTTTVPHDFWLSNGYKSFDEWLSASKAKWKRSYSWHKDRRRKLELECEKEVHFPMMSSYTSKPSVEGNAMILKEFENWLEVRKKQWLILRRKRQRALSEGNNVTGDVSIENTAEDATMKNLVLTSQTSHMIKQTGMHATSTSSCRRNRISSSSSDAMYIDEILADQEQTAAKMKEEENREPFDISWLFDSQLGAPDDIIVVIMRFLDPSDHGKLLCLSWQSNYTFKQRDLLWQTLCPNHWVLPRRPRKSWCVIYITKIREEEELSRKRSDDLLIKANNIIEKGDQLLKVEKLVKKAEKDFGFSVNYTSGVVLERNSLLNMAVISGRHKIAKWLIEEKGADIETCDRGDFTPLCNAAWDGDKYMVRYLLGKGADRKKVGTGHSSQGLAPANFKGLSAELWARRRGHDDVAELIRLGL